MISPMLKFCFGQKDLCCFTILILLLKHKNVSFSALARGRRGRLLARTLSKNLSYNRHEFEMTENENGQINFEDNSPSSRPQRIRNRFPTFDFVPKRICCHLESISPCPNDSRTLQLIFKYFRVPGISLR